VTLLNVPPLLQADIDAECTTLTRIMQVVNAAGAVVGLAELDRKIEYDTGEDAHGVVTYHPDPGFDPTELEFAHDLAVDGGDGSILLPLSALPMDAEEIRAGLWDDASFRVLRLNYEALDHGHYEVLSGLFGNITLRDNALLVIQLDGPTRRLRQTMCWRDSIKCRAVFGSQESEAIEFCGFDVASLEIAFTVTAVDPDESNRSFTASALAQAAGYFVPGIVLWDTGANAGNRVNGIDTHQTGGVIGQRDPLRFPIQVGDTGRIRVDCTKDVEGDKGCREHFGSDWVNHFRGEPDIPVDGTAQIPGATVGPGYGGSTSVPAPDTEEA
jgi:uncharacterized phage protein (TIGR02218 family)